jgi:hypothetical protein
MTKLSTNRVWLWLCLAACGNADGGANTDGLVDAGTLVDSGSPPPDASRSDDPSVVITDLERPDMCSGTWPPPRPSSFPAGEEAIASTAPFSLQWDIPARRLNAFGTRYRYTPTYKPSNVSFALNGRPLILDRSYVLQSLDERGSWRRVDLMRVARTSLLNQGIAWEANPAGIFAVAYSDKRVVFDTQCNVYVLMPAARYGLAASALLHSWDGGRSWRAYKIPTSEGLNTAVVMEMPTHTHTLLQPPVLRIFHLYDLTDVRIVVPKVASDGRLSFDGPFTAISKGSALSLEVAGGGETQTVSIGDRTYLAYAAAKHGVDPLTGRRGMLAMVTALSRSSGAIVEGPVEVGVGVNSVSLGIDTNGKEILDAHNQPTLASDASGHLHVSLGGHGGPLYYRKTTQPNSLGGWSPIEQPGERATPADPTRDQYTYPSLIIRNNFPMMVARWTGDRSQFKVVSIERESSGWKPQNVLFDPGRTFYGHWYNKASLGPKGQLALSYGYVADQLFAEEKETLETQYKFVLTLNPTVPGNSTCVPSSITAVGALRKYCYYIGMPRIEEGNLLLTAAGASFLTAERLFE